MRIQLLDKVESMHQWMDDNGKVASVTVLLEAGVVVESADDTVTVTDPNGRTVTAPDADRWLKRLVKIEKAVELQEGDSALTPEAIKADQDAQEAKQHALTQTPEYKARHAEESGE